MLGRVGIYTFLVTTALSAGYIIYIRGVNESLGKEIERLILENDLLYSANKANDEAVSKIVVNYEKRITDIMDALKLERVNHNKTKLLAADNLQNDYTPNKPLGVKTECVIIDDENDRTLRELNK